MITLSTLRNYGKTRIPFRGHFCTLLSTRFLLSNHMWSSLPPAKFFALFNWFLNFTIRQCFGGYSRCLLQTTSISYQFFRHFACNCRYNREYMCLYPKWYGSILFDYRFIRVFRLEHCSVRSGNIVKIRVTKPKNKILSHLMGNRTQAPRFQVQHAPPTLTEHLLVSLNL